MRRPWRVPVIRLAVLAVVLAGCAVPGRPIAVPGTWPPAVTPAVELNDLWNTYGDQGGHWTGGDRTASVPLPDGRTVWLFSDTFLGSVSLDHSRSANTPMPRNTMVVQEADGSLGATLYGGTPEAPKSLVEPADKTEHYWVGDGMVENGVLRVLYDRYAPTGGGGLDFKSTGTALATFSLPGLKLTELRELPLSGNVSWGADFVDDGGYTYIYGAEHGSESAKYVRLARVPAGGLGGPWQFWTGLGWSDHDADAARVLAGVGTAFSVARIGTGFVLVTVDTSIPFNPTVIAYTAGSPAGPFGNPRVLYQAPEAATGAKPIIVYDAAVHRQLGGPGKFVVSYNVNSLDPADNTADARIYRPRFLDVTWPPPDPDPAALPAVPGDPVATDVGDGSAYLSWQGIPGVSYRVYQRDVTIGQASFVRRPESFVGSSVAGSAFASAATTGIVGPLRDGDQYEFRVTAENAAGESNPSASVGVTVHIGPPAPPANPRATPDGFGAVALAWDASPSLGQVFYRVLRRDVTAGQAEPAPIGFPHSAGTSVTDQGLANDHVYEYTVAAVRSYQVSVSTAPVRVTAHHA